MNEFIGFENTGCNIGFTLHSSSEKAYRVKTEEGYLLWLPKFIFDECGAIRQEYNQMFYDNLRKAVSNYRGNL